MAYDGACMWRETQAARWLDTSHDEWVPHAFSEQLTDGVKFGDTAGPVNLLLVLTDGAKFGDTLVGDAIYRLAFTDGVKFGEYNSNLCKSGTFVPIWGENLLTLDPRMDDADGTWYNRKATDIVAYSQEQIYEGSYALRIDTVEQFGGFRSANTQVNATLDDIVRISFMGYGGSGSIATTIRTNGAGTRLYTVNLTIPSGSWDEIANIYVITASGNNSLTGYSNNGSPGAEYWYADKPKWQKMVNRLDWLPVGSSPEIEWNLINENLEFNCTGWNAWRQADRGIVEGETYYCSVDVSRTSGTCYFYLGNEYHSLPSTGTHTFELIAGAGDYIQFGSSDFVVVVQRFNPSFGAMTARKSLTDGVLFGEHWQQGPDVWIDHWNESSPAWVETDPTNFYWDTDHLHATGDQVASASAYKRILDVDQVSGYWLYTLTIDNYVAGSVAPRVNGRTSAFVQGNGTYRVIVDGTTGSSQWIGFTTDADFEGDITYAETYRAYPSPQVGLGVTLLDGVNFGDTVDTVLTYTVTNLDGIVFGDTPNVLYPLTLEDGIVFGETLGLTLGMVLQDGVVFTDNPVRIKPTDEHTINAVIKTVDFGWQVFPIDLTFLAKKKDYSREHLTSDDILTTFDGKEVVKSFSILPITKTFNARVIDFTMEALKNEK
jgi:hypothetical protein